jgi:hypothetical protein
MIALRSRQWSIATYYTVPQAMGKWTAFRTTAQGGSGDALGT